MAPNQKNRLRGHRAPRSDVAAGSGRPRTLNSWMPLVDPCGMNRERVTRTTRPNRTTVQCCRCGRPDVRIFADGKKPFYLIECQQCPIDESVPEDLLIQPERARLDRELYLEYQGDADYPRLIAVCRQIPPTCRLTVVFPDGEDSGAHQVLFGRLKGDSVFLSLGLRVQAEPARYRQQMQPEQVGRIIIGRDLPGQLAAS